MIIKTSALILAMSSLLFSAAPALAAPSQSAFGAIYQPVRAVVASQSQVVFYRETDGQPGSANVYVDGEFHSALLPQGYTSFCLAPGAHSIGAFIKDAPTFAGKRTQPFQASLKGGRTYFIKVDEGQTGMPVAIARTAAEQALKTVRLQQHMMSRASAVEACRYVDAAVSSAVKK